MDTKNTVYVCSRGARDDEKSALVGVHRILLIHAHSAIRFRRVRFPYHGSLKLRGIVRLRRDLKSAGKDLILLG